jgi:hypothetical protein
MGCDKTPTLCPACRASLRESRYVLFVPLTTIMGITRISCYSKTPAYLIAGRLCHSAALAKSQAATTHASYLEARSGKGSGNIVVLAQFGLQGAGPARTHPSVNLTPAKCRPKRSYAILRPGIFLFQVSGPR